MNTELKRLSRMTDEKSIAQIAIELGYRSPNTVVTWFKNERIPSVALARVRKYLEKEKKK